MTTTLKSRPSSSRSVKSLSNNYRGDVTAMQAMVYAGPDQIKLQSCPRPVLMAPGDAIVRVTQTTICGTGLHILKR